ncbi:hypothetical protein L2E82_29574 [Cichorium intybus]|uniref:Uncharacterized protein n=1 Tax=Cichorium intybus TaxID=13427 RepID=A0ACB9CXW4_CICIN|nr:hypothetical protein L2E82_29574 [Cichorium intybus]
MEKSISVLFLCYLDYSESIELKEKSKCLSYNQRSQTSGPRISKLHDLKLVYFGEQMVQILALVLICYIALHVPDSEDLAQAEVLTVLEWASKQSQLIQNEQMGSLLQDSKGKLELYQSRGSRGFH